MKTVKKRSSTLIWLTPVMESPAASVLAQALNEPTCTFEVSSANNPELNAPKIPKLGRLALLLGFLISLQCSAFAQFTYVVQNGGVSITSYTGPGGDVIVPAYIQGLPVTKIAAGTFSWLPGVTSVRIPSTVTSLTGGAFYMCPSLEEINVDPSNSTYSSSDGVLFDKSRSTLIRFPEGKRASYRVPITVTVIAPRAFQECTWLTDLHVPNTVTSIGERAFHGCARLSRVTLPLRLDALGSAAFASCGSLSSIEISEGPQIIDQWFMDCTNLVSVVLPGTITIVGESAFSDCMRLPGVVLPLNITEIKATAFSRCASLTNIAIPSTVRTIGDFAFSKCLSLTDITVPAGVLTIGTRPFEFCSNLRAINVDSANPNFASVDGVLFDKRKRVLVQYPGGKSGAYAISGNTSLILEGAFAGAVSLTSVTVPPSITSIPESAFYGCTALADVVLPDSVSSIENRAFVLCSGLRHFAFPGSALRLGSAVFSESGLTNISIPGSVREFGGSLFAGCTNLQSASLAEGITGRASRLFSGCTRLEQVSLPNTMTNIGELAFMGCSNLASIVLPNDLRAVESWAFADCMRLRQVTLPSNLTWLRMGAFSNNSSLESITIPAATTVLGPEVFRGCTNLAEIKVDPMNPVYVSVDGILLTKDLATLVHYPGAKPGVFHFPVTVTNMAPGALAFAPGLTAITVDPANPSFSSIDGVLFDKSASILLRYPGGKTGSYKIPATVKEVQGSAFAGNRFVSSVEIPDQVTSMMNYTFQGCTGLTNVIFGNGVTQFGGYVFADCVSLARVVLPRTLEVIGQFSFANCVRLPSIDLPDGLTDIKYMAFSGCASLTRITLPATLQMLGNGVFRDCTNLTAILFEGNVPRFMSSLPYDPVIGIGGSDNAVVYYVPGTIGWSDTFGGKPTMPITLPAPVMLGRPPSFEDEAHSVPFGFTISWGTNVPVVIEASTDLRTWRPLRTNALHNGSYRFTDLGSTNHPARFYRVRGEL